MRIKKGMYVFGSCSRCHRDVAGYVLEKGVRPHQGVTIVGARGSKHSVHAPFAGAGVSASGRLIDPKDWCQFR